MPGNLFFEPEYDDSYNISYLEAEEASYSGAVPYIRYAMVIHVPIILFSNAMVLVIFYLVKKLHTQQNEILFALAIADFICGCTLITQAFRKQFQFLRRTHGGCLFRFTAILYFDNMSLVMLAFVCFDKFLAIDYPIWHMKNITNRKIRGAIGVLYFLEFLFSVVLFCTVFKFKANETEVSRRCSFQNQPDWYGVYANYLHLWFNIAIAGFSTARVVYVAMVSFKRKYEEILSIDPERAQQFQRQRSEMTTLAILMFAFIVLWLPTLLKPFFRSYAEHAINRDHLHHVIAVHTLSVNNYLNAFVYASQKPYFSQAFWYFMKNRPSNWHNVNRFLEARSKDTATSAACEKGGTKASSTNYRKPSFITNSQAASTEIKNSNEKPAKETDA